MGIPEASLGTVIAAIIAAAISLVGLLISKDLKTTEFRQAWIDKLRDDVAEFLAYHSLMSYQIRINDTKKENDLEFQKNTFSLLKEEIAKIERVYSSILLRLNPKEHGQIIEKLKEIQEMYGRKGILDADLMDNHEKELLSLFQVVLKKEWERVKSGEVSFRLAKYSASILVVLGIIFLIYSLETTPVAPDISNKSIQPTANASAD